MNYKTYPRGCANRIALSRSRIRRSCSSWPLVQRGTLPPPAPADGLTLVRAGEEGVEAGEASARGGGPALLREAAESAADHHGWLLMLRLCMLILRLFWYGRRCRLLLRGAERRPQGFFCAMLVAECRRRRPPLPLV